MLCSQRAALAFSECLFTQKWPAFSVHSSSIAVRCQLSNSMHSSTGDLAYMYMYVLMQGPFQKVLVIIEKDRNSNVSRLEK